MRIASSSSTTSGSRSPRCSIATPGREGDVLLINGRADATHEIAAGQVERWRIINAASARYLRLSLGGRTFRIIGSDGGLDESVREVTETLLAPGDRVELAVGPFDDEGAAIAIESTA